MELSSDNIEELATAMTVNTSQQEGGFQTKTDFSSEDVDRVISEAQDSLLSTSIEAIRSCEVSYSFNDILDDICKMNKNIELQQATVNEARPQLPMETTEFYHMPDLEIQPVDYTSECSYSNQNDFLQPYGQWSEYLPMPPSALSSIQDIPQLDPIPTIPSSPPQPVETQQTQSEELPTTSVNSNSRESKVDSSVPVAPLQFFNNYHFTIPPTIVDPHGISQCNAPTNTVQFSQGPQANMNYMIFPEHQMAAPPIRIVQQQASFFDWARVVPRRAFMQPSEVVVLRPLRTRKVMSARPSFDLASYFDTSTISIPMIRERPRSKANRRKQKLYTIPGADNLIFEVQLAPPEKKDDNNNNEEQLYPETEIPELNDIFKRKRRTLNTRRNPPHQDRIKTLSPTQPVELPTDKCLSSPNNKEQESFSDVDSDDAPLTTVKSMKCLNCRKLFKTSRSLTIHSKRCKIINNSPVKKVPPELPKSKPTRKVPPSKRSSKENINLKEDCDVERVVTRSLTRSQTRNAAKRKANADDCDGSAPQKQSK